MSESTEMYEGPDVYDLPYLGEVSRAAADAIAAAMRKQSAAHRVAWEQRQRDVGRVWSALYWRRFGEFEEEFFSLDGAKAFLAFGWESGEMSPVGVRVPDGSVLEFSHDWVSDDRP